MSGVSRRRRHQVMGIAFLIVAALFFASTIGAYQKVFTSVVPVTLHTDRVGNQLRTGADVKVRGVIVGEVREIESGQGRATLRLALRPSMTAMIPSNVSARLLPKTLFGERYVALRVPNRERAGTIAAGDVISQDRSGAAIEIERVLDDLLPVLQAVRPDKLATTLNAVSKAVEGRGEQLGDTLVRLDRYLERLNPSLPDFESVVSRIDDVSDSYADAAPDLLHALDNLTTTSRTIAENREQLRDMWTTANVTSVNARQFLEANGDHLIQLSSTARPTLELLGRYAPEYPCVFNQIVDSLPDAKRAFGVGDPIPMQKVTIEITGSRGKYLPERDKPKHEDTRGPKCYPWVEPPERFPQYPPGGPLQDGSFHPAPPNDPPGLPLSNPTGQDPATNEPASTGPAATKPAPTVANSPVERDMVRTLLAPSLGVPPKEVPGWSSMLVGPVYRGTEVTVR